MSSLSLFLTLALGLLALPVQSYLVITGAQTNVNKQTGQRPSRLEIVNFSKGGAKWDLYIQCLTQIQNRPQTQIDSWYQVAGTLKSRSLHLSLSRLIDCHLQVSMVAHSWHGTVPRKLLVNTMAAIALTEVPCSQRGTGRT